MSGQQSHAKECSIPCLPSHLLRCSFLPNFLALSQCSIKQFLCFTPAAAAHSGYFQA